MAKKKKKGGRNKRPNYGIDPKLVEQHFHMLMSGFISNRSDEEKSYCYKDYDPVRVERRIKAVCAAYPEMRRHVDHIPKNTPNSMPLEEVWILMNGCPNAGVDSLECKYQLGLGAAIWILDQIQLSGKLEEFHSLTKEYDAAIEHEIDIYDLNHSEEDIHTVYDILCKRNADCTGMNRTQSDPHLERIYMDVYTCSKRHLQDVPSRKLFENIISLIPVEARTHAMSVYKEYFWKWVKYYFDSFAAVTQKRDQSNTVSIQEIQPLQNTDSLTMTKQMLAMKHQERKFETDIDIHLYLLQNLCNEAFYFICRQDDEISGIWSDFQIEDPYEACYGFLETLDSGSNLPWLYGPSSGIYHAIGLLLPWALPEMVEMDWMEAREHCDYLSEQASAVWGDEKYQRKIKDLYRKESLKWYEISFPDDDAPDNIPDLGLNMAQRLYRMNECLFPRGNTYMQDLLRDLERSTAYPEDKESLLIYAYILGARKYREQYERMNADCFDDDEEPAKQEESNPYTEIEQYKEHIAELEQKLDNFKKLNDEYKQKIKDLTKRCDNYEREALLTGIELKDLREAVFQKNIQSEEDEENLSIVFPQYTESGIVAYGGHPSWLKAIKSKLPNVNFIGAEAKPNENLIRHAKEVWIQTNALAHKDYYKIINLVRRNHIILHYFTYASAAKCAEQLIEETKTND